jgi:hypothetical protein
VTGIGKEARDGKFAFTVNTIKCGVNRIGSYFFSSKPQRKILCFRYIGKKYW